MKNKVIIIISSIIVIIAIAVILVLSFVRKNNTSTTGYTPKDGDGITLQNIELVYSMSYDYKEVVDYNQRDWFITNEPDYMNPVLEACATVLETYYKNNLPCDFEYSNSDKYSYVGKGGNVCLLTPTDTSIKSYIVEIMDDMVYLYVIN